MNVADLIKSTAGAETREKADTFKIWENYREQATMWRILALLQLATTPLLLILCIFIYSTRSVTLHVPAKPLPGHYRTTEIPKSLFVSKATEFINLVASYQPRTAERQFHAAAEMVDGSYLEKFEEESLGLELRAIENTARTQIYFIDPTRTNVEYKSGHVFVTFYGARAKYIAGREMPSVETKFVVTMKTVPRQNVNRYGIVITDFATENIA